jgi:hypothetical protein
MQCAWATVFILVFAGAAAAQRVAIRVVDEPTRLGIAHVTMTLEADGQQAAVAESDTLGFAQFTLPQRRTYTVRVRALGYLEQTREIDFAAGDLSQIPAIVLKPQALSMAPIEINARRSGYRAPRSEARASQTVAGERIARMRLHGFYLEHAIREMPGVRVRIGSGGHLCVESTRGYASFRGNPNACRMVAVVINDIPYFDAGDMIRNATLDNFESVEFLTALQAGYRYGLEAASRGALILWTRGRGPHVVPNAWINRQ